MSQIFAFHNHPVRTIIENGQPWFVGRDIALLLGYAKTDKEIRRICKHVKLFKGTNLVPLQTPPRGLLIIPESDVWRLIVNSTLPKAQEVEEWIMGEVLPSIRQTGKYVATPQQPTLPEPIDRTREDTIEHHFHRIRFLVREMHDEERAIYDVIKRYRGDVFKTHDARRSVVVNMHTVLDSLFYSMDYMLKAAEFHAKSMCIMNRV